jgi:hypothetical protein
MDKHYYIKHIEKATAPLSKVSIDDIQLTDEKLDITKYETLFMTSGYSGGKFMWKDIILKTKQGFYLFIRRHSLHKTIIDVDIYYRQEQHNELLIFIKPFVNLLTK